MRFLLDTHVVIWMGYNQPQHFSQQTLGLFNDPAKHEFFVSVASTWEMSIKASLNKPNFDVIPEQLVEKMLKIGIKILPIDVRHTFDVMTFPHIHNDPFDRLLIAQAEREKLTLLTADQYILQYQKPFVVDVRV